MKLTMLPSILLAASALLTSSAMHAQARAAGSQAIQLQVYGLGNYVRPEYSGPRSAAGFAVGGAAGFFVPHLHGLEPALDVRYTYATNSYLSQSFVGAGVRVAYNVDRIHPYADFLFGKGNINFKQVAANSTYTHDDSSVPMYGGGLDYDVTAGLALRVDVQGQRWQLASNTSSFTPLQVGVGVRYQLH